MSADNLHVVRVTTRSDERAFRELPWRLYRGDPNWVAPLRSAERRRWDLRANPVLAHRLTARFLARRGRRTVGRIAAIIDPAFLERWENAGFFGFFECEWDDVAAARALFHNAEDFLRAHEIRRVLGPVNLSTHEEVGFLVDGHDSPPAVLSPYNPPAYAALAEQAGYHRTRDYQAYLWTPATEHDPVLERALRLAAARPNGVRIRALDPARWDSELRALFELYNTAFAQVWGFVPIQWEEFQGMAESFRAFYRPELVLVAEEGDVVVGFALLLPDVNTALRPLRGRLFPFGAVQLMRAVPRLDTGRFILLGVRPDHTGHGLAARIAGELERVARRLGLRQVELSLVQSDNAAIRHVIDAFGAVPCKTYRLFGKRLDDRG